MTNREAVKQALARLERGAELPTEPGIVQFLETGAVSVESFSRALNARARILERRVERAVRRRAEGAQ